MKRKLMLLLACLFVGIGLVTAQTQTITGVVISEEDEEGLLKTTKFNRYNGRLNIDSEVTNWLKAGMSANYSRNESNTAVENSSGSSNVWYSAQLMALFSLSLRKMPMVLRFMTIWEMPFLTMVKTDRPVPVQSGTQLLPYMMICILLKAIT